MLAEVGYDRLTMDAVALRAKASKATLYRRWNGKVSLVIDALHHHHQHEQPEPSPVDTGSLRGDLIAVYCGTGGLTDKPEVAAFGAILTAIIRDPEFAAAFRRDVVAPKLAASRAIFERAIERGEIGSGRRHRAARTGPGRDRHAPPHPRRGGPRPRSSSPASSTRSSFRPPPRPADRRPSHPP